jgi:hypothetical protein
MGIERPLPVVWVVTFYPLKKTEAPEIRLFCFSSEGFVTH